MPDALDEPYSQLLPEEAAAYRRLGALPHLRVFGVHDAAAVAEFAPDQRLDDAARLIEMLAELGLVERLGVCTIIGGTRWRLSDAMHEHVVAKAREDSEEERAATLRGWVDFLLCTATAAEELLTPSHRTLDRNYLHRPGSPVPLATESAALAWLEDRLPDLMSALRAAFDAEWYPTVWQLADAMWPVFLRHRHYDLWLQAYQQYGLVAARRAGHSAAERRMLTSSAGGLRNLARYDEALAHHQLALTSARDDGDLRDQAQALHGIGDVHRLMRHPGQALSYLLEAKRLREQIEYRRGAALTGILLGDVAIDQLDPDEAVTHLTAARDTLLAEGDRYDAARALAFLARAHSAQGWHAHALTLLRQAGAEFAAAGSLAWQARTIEWTGQIHQEQGHHEQARTLYRQALALYEPISQQDTDRLRGHLHSLPTALATPKNGEAP
ncbi:tetratricopeptide repeat protein [Streptomyces sp. SBT349]|uniref:tetratricopeptide repeat protein n=1 Tax=Streptomyces sp. SBT349 TaxID=1580539 RepID=UPI00066BC6B9|nr:tetratricopeptide repeat protein [Streptomyces sp. SBT349]